MKARILSWQQECDAIEREIQLRSGQIDQNRDKDKERDRDRGSAASRKSAKSKERVLADQELGKITLSTGYQQVQSPSKLSVSASASASAPASQTDDKAEGEETDSATRPPSSSTV